MNITFSLICLPLLLCAGCAAVPTSSPEEVDLRELPCHWFKNDPTDPYYVGLQRARAFADKVAIYSVAANQVYQKDPSGVEDIPFPSNETWREIDVDGAIQDNIGFAARTWERNNAGGQPELVVAYRGTDDFWRDFFKGNLVFAKHLFGRNQFDAALEYAIKAKNSESGRHTDAALVLVGHSLGGGLAEYVQRLIPKSKAITFDTSPNQGRLYSLFSEKNEKDSIRVYEKGEILSFLRYIMSPDLSFDETPDGLGAKAIWVNFYADDIVSGHSIRDLSASLIKVAAFSGNQSALNVVGQLNARPRKLSLPEPTCQDKLERSSVRPVAPKYNNAFNPTATLPHSCGLI